MCQTRSDLFFIQSRTENTEYDRIFNNFSITEGKLYFWFSANLQMPAY